jgi:hypothetical protein
MNKEQYIQCRKTNNIPIELFWEFYLYKTTPENRLVKDIRLFNQAFQMFHRMVQLNLDEMFQYFDNKFEINILQNKHNQTIKIY